MTILKQISKADFKLHSKHLAQGVQRLTVTRFSLY